MPPPNTEHFPPDNEQYHSRVGSRPCTSDEPTEAEAKHVAKWSPKEYREIVYRAYFAVFLEKHDPYQWNEPYQ